MSGAGSGAGVLAGRSAAGACGLLRRRLAPAASAAVGGIYRTTLSGGSIAYGAVFPETESILKASVYVVSTPRFRR